MADLIRRKRKDADLGIMEENLTPYEDDSSFEFIPYADEEFFRIKIEEESICKEGFPNPRNNSIYSRDSKIKPDNNFVEIKTCVDSSKEAYGLSSVTSKVCFDSNEKSSNYNEKQQLITRPTEAFHSLVTLANLPLENSVSFGRAVEILRLQDINHHVPNADISYSPKKAKSFSFDIYKTKRKHFLNRENSPIHQTTEVQKMLDTEEELTFPKKFDMIPAENPDTKIFQRSVCMNKSVRGNLNICKWVRENKILQNIMELFKISVQSVRCAVQMEFNRIRKSLSSFFMTLTIISEESNFSSIKGAFKNVFHGEVLISDVQLSLDSIPTLPVGFSSALIAADSKIEHIRKHTYLNDSEVVISTSTFVFQAVPQRWQISTVLCLHDPTLDLSLHNFTVTTPIPNEYILAAERQTPLDYPHREKGFGITIEQAIHVDSGQPNSIQEYLSGYKDDKALESAAHVLAGMYKKYTVGRT